MMKFGVHENEADHREFQFMSSSCTELSHGQF